MVADEQGVVVAVGWREIIDEDGGDTLTMDASEGAQDRGQMGWYEDNAAE